MSEALDRAREAMRAKREAGEAVERLDPIEKSMRNPKSKALAIAAKCWDCVGAGADANPRRLIRECVVARCPLHSVRPYQQRPESAEEEA